MKICYTKRCIYFTQKNNKNDRKKTYLEFTLKNCYSLATTRLFDYQFDSLTRVGHEVIFSTNLVLLSAQHSNYLNLYRFSMIEIFFKKYLSFYSWVKRKGSINLYNFCMILYQKSR